MFTMSNEVLAHRAHKYTTTLGPQSRSNPAFFERGCGNEKFLVPAVIEAARLLRERDEGAHPSKTFAQLIGMAAFRATRHNFSWAAACRIVDNGSHWGKVRIGQLDRLMRQHAEAIPEFIMWRKDVPGSEDGISAKTVVFDLARTIVWAEALAFFIENGLDSA